METETTFEVHGHTWTRHTPGDPMPCASTAKIAILDYSGCIYQGYLAGVCESEGWWSAEYNVPIVGWHYNTVDVQLTPANPTDRALSALRKIHSLTDPYADGAPDASEHDRLALEISTITKPFV